MIVAGAAMLVVFFSSFFSSFFGSTFFGSSVLIMGTTTGAGTTMVPTQPAQVPTQDEPTQL